jgi:hypothetical protein
MANEKAQDNSWICFDGVAFGKSMLPRFIIFSGFAV